MADTRPQCTTDRVIVVEPGSIGMGHHDRLPPIVIVAMILVVSCLVATGYHHSVSQMTSIVHLVDGSAIGLYGARYGRGELCGTSADGTRVAIPLWRVASIETQPR